MVGGLVRFVLYFEANGWFGLMVVRTFDGEGGFFRVLYTEDGTSGGGHRGDSGAGKLVSTAEVFGVARLPVGAFGLVFFG